MGLILFSTVVTVTKVIAGKTTITHGALLLGKKTIIKKVGKAAYKEMVGKNLHRQITTGGNHSARKGLIDFTRTDNNNGETINISNFKKLMKEDHRPSGLGDFIVENLP